ncbi:myeloid differentiation primary response protein MyD88-B-like [Branchiostoma floridae x Branchiostoma japonicum]
MTCRIPEKEFATGAPGIRRIMTEPEVATGAEHKAEDRTQYEYDLFISCHVKQLPWIIEMLLPALEDPPLSLKVYVFERNSLPGEVIADALATAAHTSRKSILVFTQDYLQEEWNQFEANMAQATSPGCNTRCIPLKLHPCQIPDRFQSYHPLDCTSPIMRRFFWFKLLRALDCGVDHHAHFLQMKYPFRTPPC